MGVQGLTTFLETHQQIYRDVQFRMSRLVIDGCNLLHLLYSGLDQNHGGEYAAFENQVEKFIAALRACEIKPYVVLDGGTDPTDKKLETVTQRAEDRIQRAHLAAVGGSQENIVPQLVNMVFRQTLARLEVPVAKCYGEADQEIAALANELNCPVLSRDSDFYIFDLSAGLLPISHFQWEALGQSGSRCYIPCKNYKTSNICILFNIQPQLLPAFAALAGNDYVKLQRMESSIRWAQFCPASAVKLSRLEGLLCWLRSFHQPQEAFEAALGLMGTLSGKRKAELLQGLHLGMEEYRLPPSTLKRFFLHGTAPPFPAEEETAGLVPDWIRLPFTQARLPSDILDVLLLQRMNLGYPVAHADTPSAYLTSRPIRQVMYGLLLGCRGGPVQERDREGLQLKFIPVQPAFRGVAKQLQLNSLDKAEASQRLQVLLEALGVTEASLSHLLPQLRLLVAVTCYWMQRAQPRPDERLLRALLLGVTNGDALRRRADLQIQNHQKLDVCVAHAFSQWQACMKDSIQLNQLLGYPLPEPQIAKLYEGMLVHNLVHQMRTRKMKWLKYNPSSVKQYKAMLSVVHQSLRQEVSKPSVTQTTPTSPRQQHQGDLTASLQQLFLQYEDDEETATEAYSVVRALQDQELDDLLSVRTRYRARERINSGKNPDLVLKKERRGVDIM
ncbi:protein asteroid homolog 1-like isoform X2 [Sparus aurata]|uniref:protein asteroid homolog 1-like isoform X2 n=1 Tax=Sparus aurata TaxID=8175 RepID=UPI0011C10E02|nr:protein asteroid homolog 1-like isoform X2 [Sparus aurata]